MGTIGAIESRGDHATFALDGFLDDYFAECDEHLVEARRHLLALEASLGSPAHERTAVDDLFRIFHSIKGISGMVELREAEELAHEMESYLRAFGGANVLLTAEGVDALIDGAQRLEQVVAARSRSRRRFRRSPTCSRGWPRWCLPPATPCRRRPANLPRARRHGAAPTFTRRVLPTIARAGRPGQSASTLIRRAHCASIGNDRRDARRSSAPTAASSSCSSS